MPREESVKRLHVKHDGCIDASGPNRLVQVKTHFLFDQFTEESPMDTMPRYGLLACCVLLAYMLLDGQSGPFVHLIVAPALGLIGSLLLILVALASMHHFSRKGRDA